MNRKNLPLFLMLVAGAITCVITFTQHYTLLAEMVTLFIVLVVFYVLGCILKWTLDYFDRQNEKQKQAEGEVIEKAESDTSEAQTAGAAEAAETAGEQPE